MTIARRQDWPSAWVAAGVAANTPFSSPAATSSCLLGSGLGAWIIWSDNSSTLPTTVKDSANQAWTYSGKTTFDNNTGLNWALYTFSNNASATTLIVSATWASLAQTFTGIWPFEISGCTTTPFQTGSANSQDAPGTGVGIITSTNATPTSQPCLVHAVSMDSQGNASSVVAGSLVAGTTGLLLSGNTAPSGTSGAVRLTSTAAFASTFTNATDGGAASFLTGQSIWTEAAGTNTASIAWVK